MKNEFKQTAIPILPTAGSGKNQIEIRESGEKLVSMAYLPEKIIMSPQYYIQNIKGTLPEIYARKTVLTKLVEAARLLPAGCHFVIFDCWRSLNAQESLFNIYQQRLEKQYPSKSMAEIAQLASVFVARPKTSSFPHGTGGAVDLSIADENGLLLNMGTDFDDCTEKSGTPYFEKQLALGFRLNQEDTEALQNRRLLYAVMTHVGFTNYIEEWWHFDYGNRGWARVTGSPYAIYGQTCPSFPWKNGWE